MVLERFVKNRRQEGQETRPPLANVMRDREESSVRHSGQRASPPGCNRSWTQEVTRSRSKIIGPKTARAWAGVNPFTPEYSC